MHLSGELLHSRMIRGGLRLSVMKGVNLSTTTTTTNIDINNKFASKDTPKGFETILGFMSAEEFTELDIIEEPIDFIEEYQSKLVNLSEELGLEVHDITASPYVLGKGIPTELAFNRAILSTTLI